MSRKFIHLSDTHWHFPPLPEEGEFVVHSGDFYQDFSGGPNRSKKEQARLLHHMIESGTFKRWLGGRPFIFCQGNHDFYNMTCTDLRAAGIEAYDITNSWLERFGLTFYGIPYIPLIEGRWNWEATEPEMRKHFLRAHGELVVRGLPDIMVAHCPPFGVLDHVGRGRRIGNPVLTNAFTYYWAHLPFPKHLLCGHVHEDHGHAELFGMKVSQAATRVHLIELEADSGGKEEGKEAGGEEAL